MSEITVLSTRREIGAAESGQSESAFIDMDFGRLTVDDDIMLYLFGTPGDERVAYTWKMLADGLLGFVVLVDGRTNESMLSAGRTIAFLQQRSDVPYVVALNRRDAKSEHDERSTRSALALRDDVPLLYVDAADRQSARAVLAELVDEVLRRTS